MTIHVRSITYHIASSRNPRTVYTVAVDPRDGVMRCTCPARVQCRHQLSVIAGVAGKPRVRVSVGR